VRRLIVNADDFGLTAGVNRAIVELNRAGVLPSATLMARAGATEEAIELARATPALGVGCHVVLVDGEPVLSPRSEIPFLADPISGRFRPSLARFLNWLYIDARLKGTSRANVEHEIESEASAQIALLRSRGLRLTHVDTHKHTHMFPRVLGPLLRAAAGRGIRAVRNPFEPAWSVRAAGGIPLLRRAQVGALRRFEPAFRRIVDAEGFATTDGAIGVAATGTLDAAAIASLLDALPPGTWELVTHPGYRDADLDRAGTRLLASRETEREALLTLAAARGIELISFADVAHA
jgi:predicted glycoside hydrolase/deacetylase ChbG (UPF0249 family)